MAGARIEVAVDVGTALAATGRTIEGLRNPRALLRELGEFLLGTTKDRFRSQVSPDGVPWQALSPRYAARKRGKGGILTLRGFLRNQMAYQVESDEAVLVGSSRKYAAIHQFGGTIERKARAADVYFRRNEKTNEIGRLFVKKNKSNFAQPVKIGAYKINMPARPFLGVSPDDRNEISARTIDFVNGLIG